MRYYLIVIAASLLMAGPAMAVCNVPQPRLVCAEYFASGVVVEATLVGTKADRGKEDPEGALGYVCSLRADRVLHGHIAARFRVYEGNDSGRAAFAWKAGRKYLLFLFYSVDYKSWALDGCGNSGPLAPAKAVLAQIDAIYEHREGGIIHGVVTQQMLSFPILGVRVEARGTSGRYIATTNAKGEFRIEVPAGRYTVRAIRAGVSFQTSELSYEDPDNVRIEPGGCVQVQFASVEPTTTVPRNKLRR